MKINRNNKYRTFVLGTFSFLFLLAGAFVYNSVVEGASALDCETDDSCLSDTDTSTVNVKVAEVLDITATTVDGSSATTMNISSSLTPGTLASKTMVVTVATNHSTGYYLKLNGTTSEDHPTYTATSMTHTNGESEIVSLGSGTFTTSTFTAGAWGYSAPYNGTDTLGSGNYAAIPSEATTIDSYSGTTTGNSTDLTVAVKPATTTTSGTYTGYLLLTAVAK